MMSRLIFAAVMLLASTTISLSDDLTGQASIIDGDTLEIHGTRIRLWGIDAPESSQLCRGEDSLQYRCGAKAANELDTFIAKRPVSCIPISLDQYGHNPSSAGFTITTSGFEFSVHTGCCASRYRAHWRGSAPAYERELCLLFDRSIIRLPTELQSLQRSSGQ
jgi:hypothetical protein